MFNIMKTEKLIKKGKYSDFELIISLKYEFYCLA